MQILIVEDEPAYSKLLTNALMRDGYECEVIANGTEAYERASKNEFDCIVMDLSLPGMDGIEAIKKLRNDRAITPILILSARGETAQKVEGLYSGADDYITKSADMAEIVARVSTLIRRSAARVGKITVGDLTLDPVSRTANRAGKRLDLTSREFAILETLARSPGNPITRAQILDRVFGYRFQPETNIVEVHIKNLRKKVDIGFDSTIIHTVMKVGYVLREMPNPQNMPE